MKLFTVSTRSKTDLGQTDDWKFIQHVYLFVRWMLSGGMFIGL